MPIASTAAEMMGRKGCATFVPTNQGQDKVVQLNTFTALKNL